MKPLFRSLWRRLPLTPGRKHQVAQSLKRWWPGASTPVKKLLPIDIAALPEARDSWLFFGIIDWHFRFQRPQQLAANLAREGETVFYISPHFVDAPQPGYSLEALPQAPGLYQVRLHVRGGPPVYFDAANPAAQAQAQAGLAKLMQDFGIQHVTSVVQHAYWTPHALALPNNTCVYDCMDHHEGFGNVSSSLSRLESELLCQADWVSVTSDWLETFARPHNPHVVTIRNACDYQHFATPPATPYRDPQGRRVIGYFGAIAEWFDIELVERLARRFSDCAIVLVGNDTVGAGARLAGSPNVYMLGEQPYAQLPHYLYGFDVCLLPFQVLPLTLATNPVKVYEYLCAGKHVVCVDLPEIAQFGQLVDKASDHAGFEEAVARALAQPPSPEQVAQRQDFAQAQTWLQRARALQQTVAQGVEPLVSIIVLTYNNLDLTKLCLDSVLQRTDYPHFEVVVVDNASSDGTPDYLQTLAEQEPRLRLVLSPTNTGFAAGNNLGLQAARGQYLVMLNNDTVVTPGWLRTMLRHFRRDPVLGLLGPVTNNIGNEARVDVRYSDVVAMPTAARGYTLAHMGQRLNIATVAFFCVMLPRDVYEQVGPLDERFGRGFFEDDDYCRRVQQIGRGIACADDVFVHHHLSASFGQLQSSERRRLFEDNKAYYESKWGTWVPHRYRD